VEQQLLDVFTLVAFLENIH